MRKHHRTMIATALAIWAIGSVPVGAEEVKPSQVCSQEWKDFKATNGKPAKGEGREVYQTFRKACMGKHGASVTNADKAALIAKIEEYKAK